MNSIASRPLHCTVRTKPNRDRHQGVGCFEPAFFRRCYHQSSGRFSAVSPSVDSITMYRPVPRVPDFPAMERDILRFWEEHHIFDKLRAQTAAGPRWSFLDGPITANNPMGVHHAWGRSLKDM